MYYQYELTHFKGNMGHGVASDVVGAALENFLACKQKKKFWFHVRNNEKGRKYKQTTLTPPPQIADFRSQRVKRKLTPRSILRNIHVALSQL